MLNTLHFAIKYLIIAIHSPQLIVLHLDSWRTFQTLLFPQYFFWSWSIDLSLMVAAISRKSHFLGVIKSFSFFLVRISREEPQERTPPVRMLVWQISRFYFCLSRVTQPNSHLIKLARNPAALLHKNWKHNNERRKHCFLLNEGSCHGRWKNLEHIIPSTSPLLRCPIAQTDDCVMTIFSSFSSMVVFSDNKIFLFFFCSPFGDDLSMYLE